MNRVHPVPARHPARVDAAPLLVQPVPADVVPARPPASPGGPQGTRVGALWRQSAATARCGGGVMLASIGTQDLQIYVLGGAVLLAGLAAVAWKYVRLNPVKNDMQARARHREAWRQLAAAVTPADYRQVLVQCALAVEHIQRARAGMRNKVSGFSKVRAHELQLLAGEIFGLYLFAAIYAYADGKKRPDTVRKMWREWIAQNPPSKAAQAKAKTAAGIAGSIPTDQQAAQLKIVMQAWRRGELGVRMYQLLQDGERFFDDKDQWRALQIRMLHFARDGYALAPDDCWRDSRQVCERKLHELEDA